MNGNTAFQREKDRLRLRVPENDEIITSAAEEAGVSIVTHIEDKMTAVKDNMNSEDTKKSTATKKHSF